MTIPFHIKVFSVLGIVKVKSIEEKIKSYSKTPIIQPNEPRSLSHQPGKIKIKMPKIPIGTILIIIVPLIALALITSGNNWPAPSTTTQPEKSQYEVSVASDKALIDRIGCEGLHKFLDANSPEWELYSYVQQRIAEKRC